MSLLFVDQGEDYAVLFSDTLVARDDEPYMFGEKVHPIPHLNMAMAVMGAHYLATSWYRTITSSPGVSDIEDINEVAPQCLRYLWDELEKDGALPSGSSTVYHFGFPTGSDKLVRYVYRSSNDFEPERFEGVAFTAKPLPPGYEFERPQTVEELVALAVRVRSENDSQPEGGWGVRIGGELYSTLIENHSISTRLVYRFEDYDEMAAQIRAS